MTTGPISLFSSLDGSTRNKRQNRILSKRTAPAPGVGRKITLADGTDTEQTLSDAQIEIERKRRGRLPYAYGTARYDELMAKHRKLKATQERERNARNEARSQKRELSDKQQAAVERELAIAEGHPVDFRGRLLEPEPS